MNTKRFAITCASAVAGSVIVTGLIAGGATAGTGSVDEVDTPISGSALELASAAALAHTGGGTVTGTEVGDEESLYEVEVTLADGSETDVQLDAAFQVVSAEGDRVGED